MAGTQYDDNDPTEGLYDDDPTNPATHPAAEDAPVDAVPADDGVPDQSSPPADPAPTPDAPAPDAPPEATAEPDPADQNGTES